MRALQLLQTHPPRCCHLTGLPDCSKLPLLMLLCGSLLGRSAADCASVVRRPCAKQARRGTNMPVDGGVRNNPLTITTHAPARKPKMMQQGPAWLHACVCPTSQEVRKWRSIFFFSGCRLARQLPSPAQAQGSKVRELPVQELAHILPSEHGVLLAEAACNRVATEEIGSSAACRTAHGGR